jgi:hypothetical protein
MPLDMHAYTKAPENRSEPAGLPKDNRVTGEGWTVDVEGFLLQELLHQGRREHFEELAHLAGWVECPHR